LRKNAIHCKGDVAPARTDRGEILFFLLTDFFYFARAYAAGAYVNSHMGTMRSHGFYALDIRLRYFFGLVVGMAHLVTAELALAADFTCSGHVLVLRIVNLTLKAGVPYHKHRGFARGKCRVKLKILDFPCSLG
jgi:hypothetical protein